MGALFKGGLESALAEYGYMRKQRCIGRSSSEGDKWNSDVHGNFLDL